MIPKMPMAPKKPMIPKHPALLRHRVVAAAAPRMATQDAAQGEP